MASMSLGQSHAETASLLDHLRQQQQQVPVPSGQAVCLLAALSSPQHRDWHVAAIRARDEALSSSAESYGDLCRNFGRLMACADPSRIPAETWQLLSQSCSSSEQCAEFQTNYWAQLRQMAGLLLKNALKSSHHGLPHNCAIEIRHILLLAIADPLLAIRNAASSAISSAETCHTQPALSLQQWPEILSHLMNCLTFTPFSTTTSTTPQSPPAQEKAAHDMMEGALVTVRKLLEDAPIHFLYYTYSSAEPQTRSLIPLLLQRYFVSANEKWRKEALKCMIFATSTYSNQEHPAFTSSLVTHMDAYFGGLSALANDTSPGVRRLVCQAIVSLLSLRTEYVHPHLASIAQFMMTSTTDADPTVALEACEFWLTFCSLEDDVCTPDMVDTVGTMLPQLIPSLLKNMVYQPDQQEELLEQNEQDERDAQAGAENLAPVFHKSRAKRSGDDENDDDDDEDDGNDDDGNEWTLRKCAAASLDGLSELYEPNQILPPLLPILQEGLSHTDPWVRDASILALGAVANGCAEAMSSSYMAQLHPYLMVQLTTPNQLPQVKSIAAWTLSRYGDWAVEQTASGAQPELIGKMTEALMGLVLDRNRRVQIASCSAFGVLVEYMGDLVIPYLEPVYQTFIRAFQIYHTKSLLTLCDTIGIMAEYVGPAIGEGSLPSLYVPPMLKLWDVLAKQNPFDKTLLPLMESLASIALTIGMDFQPWALETFEYAMGTIEACNLTLISSNGGDDTQPIDDGDADPIVCAADLLDGLLEGLQQNFGALVSSSQRYGQHFLTVLHMLASHEVPGVRMSAFALLGDLARHTPSVIEPGLSELVGEAVSNMVPNHAIVCNNAIWAIGEVCVRCGTNSAPLEPFAERMVHNLIALLMGSEHEESNGTSNDDAWAGQSIPGLAENSAAAMGRLAKLNVNFVAPELGRFLIGWCNGMAKISDMNERSDAFQGFILSLHANPDSIQIANGSSNNINNNNPAVMAIVWAVASWQISPQEDSMALSQASFRPFPLEYANVGAELRKLLHDLKSSMGDALWKQTVASRLPVAVRQLIRDTYEL